MSASNATAIKLDWALPTATDSLAVLRYLVWSDLGVPGSSHVVHNSTALNQLTFTHSGLSPGTLYSYWLQV